MNNHTCVRRRPGLGFAVACALALTSAITIHAEILPVINLNDDGPGSLRRAIADAAPGDTITFRVEGTITLTSGALTLSQDLLVQGPGPNKLKISGNHASRVFFIEAGDVTLSGMTISDGLADAAAPGAPSTGGGILNRGSLSLTDVVVSNNRALGDRTVVNPANAAVGAGAGGGVANGGELVVTDCWFVGNLVRGGDGSISVNPAGLAGLGYGGALFHDKDAVSLTVTGSTFRENQALGGSSCFSPILSGHGSAGAIGSQANLVVSDCRFDHNLALAGENNRTMLPYGFGPNKATAGAINISGGTAVIDGCTIEHNEAIGGAGGIDSGGGLFSHAGAGSGGGIVVTDVVGFGVNATISNCMVAHNRALGGVPGATELAGDGLGGGIACIAGATLTLIDSAVEHNHAQGGEARPGGQGGNGLGGGLYEDAGRTLPLTPGASTLSLQGGMVTQNLALSGEASGGGTDGQGIGGGVYYLSVFTSNATSIEKNHASTSANNLAP